MTEKAIDSAIDNAIREEFAKLLAVPPESVPDDADLYADLGGDSLEKLEVVAWIEENFAIKVSDSDAAEANTIAALASLVRASLSRRRA
jgi:acyl carrier protein